jgi:hypothetical protein
MVSGLTTLTTNGRIITATGPLAGAGAFKVSGGGTVRTADSSTLAGGSLGTVSAQSMPAPPCLPIGPEPTPGTGAFDGPGTSSRRSRLAHSHRNFDRIYGRNPAKWRDAHRPGSLGGQRRQRKRGRNLMGNGIVGPLSINAGGTLAVGTSDGLLDAASRSSTAEHSRLNSTARP